MGGDLVWIQGLYPAGEWTDIKIFNQVLRNFLDTGERVKADNCYMGAADKVKCPDDPFNPVQSRVRSRHKMINGRFKTWGILKNTYRHNIRRHGEVFRAIAIVTQLGIDNGEPLFRVDYED